MKPTDLPRPAWAVQPDQADPPAAGAWSPQHLAVQFVADVVAAIPCGDDAAAPQHWWVDAGGQRLRCRVATSLLLQPAVGDRVMCCQTPAADAPTYLLAVLERPQPGPALTVAIGPAARLLAQPDGLRIEAPALQAVTQRAKLQADEVQVVARAWQTVAETWGATVKQMRLIGGLFTSVFEREVLHAGQHSRTVEGLARTQAPVIEHEASQLLHLRGQQVLTQGERLVKTQGAQIHLG